MAPLVASVLVRLFATNPLAITPRSGRRLSMCVGCSGWERTSRHLVPWTGTHNCWNRSWSVIEVANASGSIISNAVSPLSLLL